MRWLKHAFAVDPDGPAEATDAERAVAARLCREIVRRRMATPALMFLEMCRPLNYLGSQAMHFFAPGVWAVARQRTYEQYKLFAAFLERRGSMDYLERRIEELELEFGRQQGEKGPPAPPPGPGNHEEESQPR